jgi:hypothetical protein
MIVDSAIYVAGHRSPSRSLDEVQETYRDGGFAWIGL